MSFEPSVKEEKKQLKLFFQNSSWTFIGNILRVVLLMVKSVIVARGLGVEFYGICSLVFASTGILQELFNLNIGTTVVKFGALYKVNNEKDKLFALIKVALYTIVVTAILSTLSFVIIKSFYPEVIMKGEDLKLIYILFALVSCSDLFDYMLISILRVYDYYKQVAFLNFLATFVEVGLIAICFSYYGPSITTFFVVLIIARLVKSLLLFWYTQDKLKGFWNDLQSGKLSEISSDYKNIGWFTFNNSLGRKIQSLISKGDVLILGYFTGAYEVGLYTLAKKLASYVMVPVDPMVQSIFPQLSNLVAKRSFLEIKYMLRKITLLISLGGLVAMVLLFIIPDFYKEIIALVFSKDYSGAWDAFSVLFVNGIISAIFFWHLSLIQSLGLVKLRLLVNGLSVLIGLVFAYLLIPSLKSTGAAVALTISNTFIVVVLGFISYSRVSKQSKLAV